MILIGFPVQGVRRTRLFLGLWGGFPMCAGSSEADISRVGLKHTGHDWQVTVVAWKPQLLLLAAGDAPPPP